MNKALVIVHPDQGYIDDSINMNNEFECTRVLNDISKTIEEVKNKMIYVMIEEYISVYSSIKGKKDLYIDIAPNIFSNQALLLKEKLIHDKIEEVTLCGFSKDLCIRDLENLLGGLKDDTDLSLENYKAYIHKIGWNEVFLYKIISTEIKVYIDKNLTA